MSRLIPNANNNKGRKVEKGGGGEEKRDAGSFVLTEKHFCHLTKEASPTPQKRMAAKTKNKFILKVRGNLLQVQ